MEPVHSFFSCYRRNRHGVLPSWLSQMKSATKNREYVYTAKSSSLLQQTISTAWHLFSTTCFWFRGLKRLQLYCYSSSSQIVIQFPTLFSPRIKTIFILKVNLKKIYIFCFYNIERFPRRKLYWRNLATLKGETTLVIRWTTR